MKSMRKNIEKSVSLTVRGEFLGSSTDVKGTLLAIESYEGSTPTFTWKSNDGHVFCYLPPHAFGLDDITLAASVDLNCPAGPIDVSYMRICDGGFAKVGDVTLRWNEYIATVDWYESNTLIHIVKSGDKILCVRNSRFQVGGFKLALPEWKKCRKTWSV